MLPQSLVNLICKVDPGMRACVTGMPNSSASDIAACYFRRSRSEHGLRPRPEARQVATASLNRRSLESP